MEPAQLLIHVGYHKTASSWLQSAVFRSPEAGFRLPWRHREIVDGIVLGNPFRFDPVEVGASFSAGIAMAHKECLVPVISSERLSGNPHSGGYDGSVLADRLATMFPYGRILIVIREQRSILLSIYKQYVTVGGAASIEDYVHRPRRGAARVPLFQLEFLEYHWLIQAYMKLFGSENVLVLPWELLNEDPGRFVAAIADFGGGRVPPTLPRERTNMSLSALSTSLKRRLNLFFIRDSVNLSPILPMPVNPKLVAWLGRVDRLLPPGLLGSWERRTKETVDRLVQDRYRKSNVTTSELTGLDLPGYGYDCG